MISSALPMTAPTPERPPNGHESPANWVSTSAAAAALGISERTVLRRAAAGKLESKREITSRGLVVVVALDTDEVPTGADIVPTGADTQTTLKTPQIASEVPTGADGADRGADTDLTTHLAEENRFLRGVIEQLQRDGAETRAALREALKAPRQLTSGTTPTAPEAPTATAPAPDGDLPSDELNDPQNGANSPEVSSYGALADWLEDAMGEGK